MNETAIRARATQLLEWQRLKECDEESFHNAIKTYIGEIPLSNSKKKYCPACESAACGICGQCHELDRKFVFVGQECPKMTPTSRHENFECTAWSWAYGFLKDGREEAERQA